MIVLLPAKR